MKTTNLKKGTIVPLRQFSFVNKAGGTGESNWKWNERFQGTAEAIVIRKWNDYECGWRYWGEAASQDLVNYLEKVGSPEDKRVFFGEFDIKCLENGLHPDNFDDAVVTLRETPECLTLCTKID